jgi:threonylcarbamoyladenosine tRNA methylthiotransferase MtaB
MPTAAIITLGCKLNQYESEQMRQQLEQLGYVLVDFDDFADLYIINSCTVTGRTDRDTRRLARRARRHNPAAFILLTGCYAQVAAEALTVALPEVNLILGHEAKTRLAELVPQPQAPTTPLPHESPADFLLDEFVGHTRCFVKVQEGCNARCTYCLIPDARGPSRSVPMAEVLEQAQRLGQAGHPELVLIGTHLGQYGRDLPAAPDLAGLISRLCHLPEVRRLRLSSIEPCEITPELEEWVAVGGQALRRPGDYQGKLCRHLHIPLQSGSDTVLQRMNRPYDSAFYASLVTRLHDRQPLTGLGADVIVGFPGETEDEFQQTVDLLTGLPLAYLHVFTYSPRTGTPAAAMPGQLDHEVKIARNHVLRALSEAKRAAFARSVVGQTLEVVLQSESAPGWLTGVADNYLTVRVAAPAEARGQLVACEITGAEGEQVEGRLTK